MALFLNFELKLSIRSFHMQVTMHFYSCSLLLKPTTNAEVLLLPSRDHHNKTLPCAPSHPLPPGATTMVLHPLIKKGNNSQGAASLVVSRIWGGAAEPLNPGLRCISYCNCSTLGSKQPEHKAVWGQAGGCQGGWWRLKCGEKAEGVGAQWQHHCLSPET